MPGNEPLRFGKLFSRTYTFFKAHARVMLAIAVASAAFSAVGQGLLLSLGVTATGPARVSVALIAAIIVFGLLSFVVSYIAMHMYWVLAVDGKDDVSHLFKRSLQIIFPLMGVYAWTFVRTYSWILLAGALILVMGLAVQSAPVGFLGGVVMVVGAVFTIARGPRYMPGPIIYLMEHKGIKESVDLSYPRTEGYWGKIVGNQLLFGICMWVISMVIIIVFGMLGLTTVSVDSIQNSPSVPQGGGILTILGTFLTSIVQAIIGALSIVFAKELAVTVMAHPRTAKK